MNWIFKLAIFNLSLNFAVGLMLVVFPAFTQYPTGGLTYDNQIGNEFESNMAGAIQPTGELEDKQDAIARVLDMMTLGFVTKFLNAVNALMFGFWNQLENLLGSFMEDNVRTYIFTTLKVFISIGYILGAFYLWTGKEINQ